MSSSGARSRSVARVCSHRGHRGTAQSQQRPVRPLGTGTCCSPATRSPNTGTEQRLVGGWRGLGELLWIGDGPVLCPVHVGTHLSLGRWHPAVAGRCHGQPQWLGPPCPAQALAWWHQGTSEGSLSLCSGAGDSGGCTRGSWGPCTPAGFAPGIGHCASGTVLAQPWTRHMQGGIQESRGQGWPLAGVAVAAVCGCSSSTRTFPGTCVCKGFARSCFLLRKTPVRKKKKP